MRFNKWLSALTAGVVLSTSLSFASLANAEENRTIADESIYDILVDRFFNGTGKNDDHTVNAQDPTMFAGGDFDGVLKKIDYVTNMGYTMLSVGSVFATEKYDGSMPTSYTLLDPRFGTADEFKKMVGSYQKREMKIMADFPITDVSPNHELAEKQGFVGSTNDGKIQWDLTNEEVQNEIIDSAVQFVDTYGLDGVRLTNIEQVDTAFLNRMIEQLKATGAYVIANAESDANFDAKFYNDVASKYTNSFKNVDLDTSVLEPYIEETLSDTPVLTMTDTIWSDRFTLAATAEGMYPPTRSKISIASTLLLPGVPVVQYGSEIAMNGTAGEEAHQYYNFKTDSELADYVGKLQSLRNDSETLRNGEFKWLENEDGFIVFERKSDTETWIVVINNSSKTKRVHIPVAELGEGKEIRGMFNSEIIRENKDNNYTIILDREMVEVYQVIDARGINTSYIVALGLVVVLYTAFMIVIMKRGKQRRANSAK
ncbi:alpha-glucosidase C-terminal domain-containing protein [Solibacillus sp. A46]|uniref:Alpha-glucosidase C-terminal domain-containing protein n=1 Tax=Solibacillus faecavium TaxID=2762221 RepID=A0ABR8XUP9_9BACL|nr:alpha-amylase family glycosyl hydrolase [Solibacillus faecavium]MBD8035671.1 alpha-glucosidase C-terminal domain-containing protein [Solibacillus faecavium]